MAYRAALRSKVQILRSTVRRPNLRIFFRRPIGLTVFADRIVPLLCAKDQQLSESACSFQPRRKSFQGTAHDRRHGAERLPVHYLFRTSGTASHFCFMGAVVWTFADDQRFHESILLLKFAAFNSTQVPFLLLLRPMQNRDAVLFHVFQIFVYGARARLPALRGCEDPAHVANSQKSNDRFQDEECN